MCGSGAGSKEVQQILGRPVKGLAGGWGLYGVLYRPSVVLLAAGSLLRTAPVYSQTAQARRDTT